MRDNWIWIGCFNLSLLRREYVWRRVNVLTNSPKIFAYHYERLFPTQLDSQWSMIMGKMLLFRFQQCLVPFAILLVEGSLKPEFLDISLTMFFEVLNLRNASGVRVIFFLKMFKIWSRLQKSREKLRKNFLFLR